MTEAAQEVEGGATTAGVVHDRKIDMAAPHDGPAPEADEEPPPPTPEEIRLRT